MIHWFKKFVIKGEDKFSRKAMLSGGAALAAIEQYRSSPLSLDEEAAIKTIEKTIMTYMKALITANEAFMEGEVTRDIDKMIKIADGPALKAIKRLQQAISASNKTVSERHHVTKTDIYGRMLSSLGYGGMVHNFTNYMIRHDAPRIRKIRNNIKVYRKAARQYRSLGVTNGESRALGAIDTVLTKYEADIAVVTQAIRDGLLPTDISHRIKPDFKSMKSGLDTLKSAIVDEITASKGVLSRDLKTAQSFAVTVLLIALIATGLMMLLNSFIVFTRIVVPIRQIKSTMYDLARGELGVKIKYTERRDEIGSMARAINVFRKNAEEVARLEQEKLIEQEKVAQKRRTDMIQLSKTFENSVGNVVEETRKAIGKVEETAQNMQLAASSNKKQAESVNSAATESSTSVTVVATSSHQLEGSIEAINREVEQSRQIAARAQEESERSKHTMHDLVERAKKINGIVDMINDIAGQTNLLALNATIEASRAGEAGKGFAVVASEVKTLSEQTSKATDEIAKQIGALQKISAQAAENMDEVGSTVERMSAFAQHVSDAMTEQSAATHEISHNVGMAANGANEVTQGVSMLKISADESGEAADQLRIFAKELAHQSSQLDDKVNHFVTTIRAA